MEKKLKIALGARLGLVGAILLPIVGSFGIYGTRGQEDIHSFEYSGRPAAIVREDVRWGPDKYFIRLREGETILTGKIVTDDGEEISINPWEYSIKDQKSEE